jgi:RNA-binding protein 5/10
VEAAVISEDNMGHKLLKGLGWQQGTGLGADQGGIVEPISSKAAADRAGLGAHAAEEMEYMNKDGTVDYSLYRKQRSSQYHSRF